MLWIEYLTIGKGDIKKKGDINEISKKIAIRKLHF